jgi:hypothetical protein
MGRMVVGVGLWWLVHMQISICIVAVVGAHALSVVQGLPWIVIVTCRLGIT